MAILMIVVSVEGIIKLIIIIPHFGWSCFFPCNVGTREYPSRLVGSKDESTLAISAFRITNDVISFAI